jgi:hypothetical protein
MKKFATPFLLTVMFIACNNQPAAENKTDSPAIVPSPMEAKGVNDTLFFNNKRCIVYPLAESPFGTLATDNEQEQEANEKIPKSLSGQVIRMGDSLLIKTGADTVTILANNHNDDGNSYVNYTFGEFLPEINCFLINADFYEGGCCVLINRDSGEKVEVWSKPVISPDKKWLLCPSFDLEAAFLPNGFQLLSYNNGKIVIAGEQLLEKWGPGRVKWLDNNTLVAERIEMDYNKSGDMRESRGAIKMVFE